MADAVCFKISGNIPSKKNCKQIFRNSKTGKSFITSSNAYKDFQKSALIQLEQQKSNNQIKFPIEKCKSITVHIHYGTLHLKDNSNTIESVHDLLVDAGIISDDNWMVTGITTQIPFYRKGEPGCDILIEPHL